MRDVAALHQAVLDDPASIDARIAYADALVAAGDPRGELIHVQRALDACAPGDPRWAALAVRERALFTKHRKAWTAPFGRAVPGVGWRWGMIERASVVPQRFVCDPGVLLEREPVVELSARELTRAHAAILGARPELARLRTLRVRESRLGAHIAEIVSPRLARLVELDLYQAGVDDEGLARVGESVFAQLDRLVLSGNRLSPRAVAQLLEDRRLARLTSLSLAWLASGPSGAALVAQHLALPSLRHLDLASHGYTTEALRPMARNPCFRRLRSLRLEHNALDASAIDALAPLTELAELDLSTNAIGADGAAALAASKLPLRRLRLMQARLGPAGARALAAASSPLEHLDLAYCDLDAGAVAHLASAPWPLVELNLWANKIGDDGLRALSTAPFTRTMRQLTLGFCGLTDAGVAALAAGSWPALERIVFRGDSIGEAGAKALAASTGLPALRSVKLEGMKTPKGPLGPLRKRGVAIET